MSGQAHWLGPAQRDQLARVAPVWPGTQAETSPADAYRKDPTAMEQKITYFEEPGKGNTAKVIELALDRAKSLAIGKIVVASTRGGTARALSDAVDGQGLSLVVVPWQFGFMGEENPFPAELAAELREHGHVVHFGTMLFHTSSLYGNDGPQALANMLRAFGQGMKVCVEILLMACDGGHVGIGEQVVAVAGTGNGADTAIVATAASSTAVASLRVNQIICKPIA